MDDSISDVWDQRQAIKVELTKRLWNDGFAISHVVFQLSVEDLVDVLADMIMDGKFDKDDPEMQLYEIIDVLNDDLEELIDWRTAMKACIFAYMFGVGLDRAARLEREQAESAT